MLYPRSFIVLTIHSPKRKPWASIWGAYIRKDVLISLQGAYIREVYIWDFTVFHKNITFIMKIQIRTEGERYDLVAKHYN